MSVFNETIVAAVTDHMNGDHGEDNLLIARAHGYPDVTECRMTGLDENAGVWSVTDPAGVHELSIDWPGAPLSERPQIRKAVVLVYRDACKRLGVAPREEHEEPEHLHASATGQPEAAGSKPEAGAAEAEAKGFAAVIRSATWSDHDDSEGSTFMADIMRGIATREDYVALVVQHYFMYEALEEATELLIADPRFAGFHVPDLARMAALEEDLEFLVGADWRTQIHELPATKRYADRIREVAREGWLPGVVAHHYTRYLGDLSGGQMIARRVSKQHGFERAGVVFYDFASLGGIPEFKDRYRAALDALGGQLDEAEKQRVLDEVVLAYRFNTEVFVDLARAKAGTLVAGS